MFSASHYELVDIYRINNDVYKKISNRLKSLFDVVAIFCTKNLNKNPVSRRSYIFNHYGLVALKVALLKLLQLFERPMRGCATQCSLPFSSSSN